MTDLWTPGQPGPHEDLVERIQRQVARFARERGIERAVVELELRDGSRFELDAILPEPGYGFVTIRPHPGEDDIPSELILSVAMIERIELYASHDKPSRFGFTPTELAD